MPEAMYRMPTLFGPLPGPRSAPSGIVYDLDRSPVTDEVWIRCAADGEQISRLLPAGFEVARQPDLQLECRNLTQVAWLGDRGYNLVSLSTAVVRTVGASRVPGRLQLVLWENHADPIITGRDELGYSKLYAEIPGHVRGAGNVSGEASWDAFTFLRYHVDGLTEGPVGKAGGSYFHLRYLPRPGVPGAADVSQLIETPPAARPATVLESFVGTGSFGFDSGSWQDLPTLHSVVGGLGELEIGESLGAGRFVSTGGRDLGDSRVIEDLR